MRRARLWQLVRGAARRHTLGLVVMPIVLPVGLLIAVRASDAASRPPATPVSVAVADLHREVQAPAAAVELGRQFGLSRVEVAAALRQAGYDTGSVATALRDPLGTPPEAASQILLDQGASPSSVASALRDAYRLDIAGTGGTLARAGLTAVQVTTALVDARGAGAVDIVQLLRAEGFSLQAVAAALRDGVHQPPAEALRSMFEAGVPMGEAAMALKDGYLLAPVDGARAFRDVFGAFEAGTALRNVYALTAADARGTLAGAGFSAADVALVLRDVYYVTG